MLMLNIFLLIIVVLTWDNVIGFRSLTVGNLHRYNKNGNALAMKLSGRVKSFNPKKGYGFITADNGSGEIFVHQSVIHAKGFRSLNVGEQVEFDIQTNAEQGKTFAVNVTGPDGRFVEGAQREPNMYNSNYMNNV